MYISKSLNPCPCCGHAAIEAEVYSPSDGRQRGDWVVRATCPECGLSLERQNAIDVVEAWNRRVAEDAVEVVHGRWIPLEYDGYADGNPVWDLWECSECQNEHSGDEDTLTPYCPNCGAKMDGTSEDSSVVNIEVYDGQ